MNNTIDQVVHHSAILELDLKSYRAEAAQMRADQAGAPMRPDAGVSDYYFGRDRRLQAISGARFSWPQTQTGQIADSETVVLPAAMHKTAALLRKFTLVMTNYHTRN